MMICVIVIEVALKSDVKMQYEIISKVEQYFNVDHFRILALVQI